MLAGAVLTAVHHAEMVAAKVGEPFGTLILAVAVTVIEVALILTLMLTTPDEAATLARDTAFAAVMIILTGVIGACLLAGTIKHHAQDFKAEGASGRDLGHHRAGHADPRAAGVHHQLAAARRTPPRSCW